MKQYEAVLDKVSPTFYKSLQYYDYFNKSTLITSYLDYAKVPRAYLYFYTLTNNIYYYIIYKDHTYPFEGKTAYGYITMVTTKDKMTIYDVISSTVFIVNMVINGFSFENEYLNSAKLMDFKTLFITLVGKDMYETLRANIK